MKTIDIGPALAAAQQVKAGIDKLQARRTELQAKIGELKERIAVLWRAPLSRAEIKAQMLDAIDAHAKSYLQGKGGWKKIIALFAIPVVQRYPVGGEVDFALGNKQTIQEPFTLNLQDIVHSTFGLNFTSGGYLGANGSVDHDALCFLLGDRIKAAIEENFDDWCPKISGPVRLPDGEQLTIEERREEIAVHDDAIGELRLEIDDIEAKLQQVVVAGAWPKLPSPAAR